VWSGPATPFTDLHAWLSERAHTADFSGVVLICRDAETVFAGARDRNDPPVVRPDRGIGQRRRLV
jgi:hypothetical protein